MTQLTYRDVRIILALLDGWQTGRVHFRHGDLTVDAVCGTGDAVARDQNAIVHSPAVGVFESGNTGRTDDAGFTLGHVRTPGHSVAVTAEGGRASLLVHDGDFVEFAQPLATIVKET